jgi:hypothetical protein
MSHRRMYEYDSRMSALCVVKIIKNPLYARIVILILNVFNILLHLLLL